MNSQDPFFLDSDERDGLVILTPDTRELTFKNSKEFLSKAKNLTGAGNRVVLCLKNVEIIDSMSLGTLMALLKHLRKHGGDMVVTDLSAPIKELFRLLNFTSVFRCFASVDDAVKKF